MDLGEVRTKYLEFFKARGHTVIPSASLVPENDPTTLFTGSGMQPLVPYLLGQPHPAGVRLTDSQKCFRSMDIEEVGDNRHTTFFEMLGNWSLGDYFKQEQLPWFFSFLTDELGIDPTKLYVTVFAGDENLGIAKDTESVEIWKKLFAGKGIDANDVFLGSEENGGAVGMQGGRIFYYDAKKNWWSRSGVPSAMPAGEPGGPDSEMFYDFGTPHDPKFGKECHPNCDCGRFLEIGNSVFMQYIKQADGSFAKLPKQNVDFGGGLERILAATNGNADIFTISVFQRAIGTIELFSSIKDYVTATDIEKKAVRIISDHLRAAVFLIADGVTPGPKERGYLLRKLLQRAVWYASTIGYQKNHEHMLFDEVVNSFVDAYSDEYPNLKDKRDEIDTIISGEVKRFSILLINGRPRAERLLIGKPTPADVFNLHQSYGLPMEMIREIATQNGAEVDFEGVEFEMKKHQELSQAGSEQKFKGGLADHGEVTTMLHTCTHLMLAALRKYLGPDVHQAGSNITAERTRFDFTYPEKVPREVLDKVEAYVNEAIAKKSMVTIVKMKKEDAKAAGVEGSFWEKYPDEVNVYEVKAEDGTIYSRELCGGPHVENTATIKGTFKIIKEEASSAGIRRIKAALV